MLTALAETPGAEGAALDQILIGAAIMGIAYIPVVWFLYRERAGHTTAIGRLADWIATKDGLPRWAGLPTYLAMVSIISAGFGVYWDVPIHMQLGRDEGPLANPSHYPILFGILGFFASGLISAALARDPLPRRVVRFAPSWQVPMGSMVLIGAGFIAALGFPADDVWHRLFGQDVTEWGPTHVMMIGGAVTVPVGLTLLLAEAVQVGGQPFRGRMVSFIGSVAGWALGVSRRVFPWVRREVPQETLGDRRLWTTRFHLTLLISFCIIPMAFLMEFDLGVPQFPAATLFIISGFLTGWVFTAARLVFGPGGALVAGVTYQVLRILILVITLPIPEIHRARWLLFLGAALAIELVAAVVRSRGPLFGAAAGAAAGSLGMLVEWWWMGVFMPYPLPVEAEQLPLMIAVGTVAGLGGGLVGVAHARHVQRVVATEQPAPATAGAGRAVVLADVVPGFRWAGTVGVLVFVVLMGVFAPPRALGEVDVVKDCEGDECRTSYVPKSSDVVVGSVDYEKPCIGEEGCQSRVTMSVDPTDAFEDPVWVSAIAYQGKQEGGDVPGDGVVTMAMDPTGEPGEYATADRLPLHGSWKVLLRVHLAPTTMLALPAHMPEDPGIEGAASGLVVTAAGDEVPFVHEPMLLQRERKDGVPSWLWTVAYALVVGMWLGLLAFYGWCYAAAAGGAGNGALRGRTRSMAPASGSA
ncbi:MAG TPA: hypothetical protein VD859_14130 [Nocardioides sp.]|nr:hypothetical protein [Nocardioides sp.]